MEKIDRVMPALLSSVRTLPFGSYDVRVVHLEKRDGVYAGGKSLEHAREHAKYVEENVPHAVLHLEGRVYVIDDAQQFLIGTTRQVALAMFGHYTLVVSEPSLHTGITEDRTQGASVRYLPKET